MPDILDQFKKLMNGELNNDIEKSFIVQGYLNGRLSDSEYLLYIKKFKENFNKNKNIIINEELFSKWKEQNEKI